VATSPDTIHTVARRLANLDHRNRDAAYVEALRHLRRVCGDASPAALGQFATTGYRAVAPYGRKNASYLSVLRSLGAGSAPNGPPGCRRVLDRFAAELAASSPPGKSYAGYAATTSAWASAHRADRAHPGGYLPRLGDGDDSLVAGGEGRVTTLTRNFDPPVSRRLAVASIRRQLLPGGLHSVYTLPASNCYEVIYLGQTLGHLLSSSALGVMIELTSGHGIASHYDPALVDRAILTVGGRIGGQPCV
jgi:hypothetical protein